MYMSTIIVCNYDSHNLGICTICRLHCTNWTSTQIWRLPHNLNNLHANCTICRVHCTNCWIIITTNNTCGLPVTVYTICRLHKLPLQIAFSVCATSNLQIVHNYYFSYVYVLNIEAKIKINFNDIWERNVIKFYVCNYIEAEKAYASSVFQYKLEHCLIT